MDIAKEIRGVWVEGKTLFWHGKCVECGAEEEIRLKWKGYPDNLADWPAVVQDTIRSIEATNDNYMCDRCQESDTYYEDVVSEWYRDR
jgi:hypothetical protein